MLAFKECMTENKQKDFYLILETVGEPLQVLRDVIGGANTVGEPLKIPKRCHRRGKPCCAEC